MFAFVARSQTIGAGAGVGAALVRDLLAQHTEEQTHYQIEDIDKETKFI